MSPFVVNSNSLFLCGNTNGAVTVVDAGTDLNTPTYSGDNWKIVATAIGGTQTAITISAAAAGGTKVYRAVEIFGKVIEGASLHKLCQDLSNSQVLANRDGYQVRYLGADGGKGFVIGNNYLMKLNNLFGWGKYGVKKSPEGRRIGTTATVWNRYDMSTGEAVVDYAAAELKAEETAAELEKRTKELRESEARAAEKEEILGHYKWILEEKNKVMKEMENGKNRLKEVLEEKKRVIEEQRRVVKEKEAEIEAMMMKLVNGDELKERDVVDDDDGGGLKAAMASCMNDLKRVTSVTNKVLFVNMLLVTCFILGLIFVRMFW